MLPEGNPAHLVLSSLQRLRNPHLRYVSGDVGSVLLPDAAAAQLDPEDNTKKGEKESILQWQNYLSVISEVRVLRLPNLLNGSSTFKSHARIVILLHY